MQELAPPDRAPPSYAVHNWPTAASGLSQMYDTRHESAMVLYLRRLGAGWLTFDSAG
jgi:hypothetical protein